MNSPRSSRRHLLWLVILMVSVAAASNAPAYNYTPPSPPTKTWEYFNDNYFSLANRSATNGSLIITTAGATQATGTSGNTAYQQQYEVLANLDDWTYRIINRESGLCLAPLGGGTAVGTSLAAVTYTGASNQKWFLTGTGGGYWVFVHANTGLAMQTDGGTPASVTLQAVNAALTTQQWLANNVSPVDHFPKKGQAGWDGTVWSFQPNWFYNWSASQPNLPGQTNYIPMKAQRYWPGTGDLGGGYNALHSTPRPVSILGFNEPDHTDQANMTTDQAIAGWAELQNLNVPLGSPAAASTWGGWMSDFYNKISSNGYRVDFTAIHNYPTDPWNLNSYLSNVNSVANTWGRPVWITEFTVTGWGSYVSWTEENCWTWLAEFMWRAEDYPNLRRYSYYPYANDPPANPWNPIGTGAAGLLKGDSSTLTNIGELYASWDADRSIKARTSYMLQGKQSMMRLSSSTANSLFPAIKANYLSPVSIRVSGAQAQWSLVAAPTSGQYYLCSLLDGRRLQTDGSQIVFAPPGTTGGGVQWTIAADTNGYFFINNPAYNVTLYSHRDNDSGGAPTGAYYGVTPSGTASDYTRFRLVKPLSAAPVPTAAPAVPTGLTVTPGDRRNVLRWNGPAGAAYYTISRSQTVSPTFATVLATNWPNTTFVDNSVPNGTTYYYTVTASNLLADTSAMATMTPSTAAANLATLPDLEGNYKFESGNGQDNSGNAMAGATSGDVTFFSPGKVDGYALNFNGLNTYVQVPAVVANDFSVAFWLRTTTAGTTGAQWYNGVGLVDAEVSGTTTDYGVSLLGTKVAFGVGNPDTTIVSSGAVNDGAWHLVVATRNGTTGALALYVDGALQASGTGPAALRAAPMGIRLGALLSGGGYYKGDLDEVRLYSYVLGASSIAKLATAGGTVTVAQYSLDNDASDGSGMGNQGTATNLTFGPGKVGNAAIFDGSSSYATLPQSLTNDFTISYWLKTTSAGFTGTQWWQGAGLVDGEVSGAMNDFGTSLLGGKVAFGVGNTDTTITSTSVVNDGNWHLVTATRINSTGAMRLYIDGALQTTGTGPIGPRTASPALAVGRLLPGSNYFNGALDDIRLYNYALPAGQIMSVANPVPSPWTAQDVGSPLANGYASYTTTANGTWTVGGSGADIWGSSDQFAFVSTPVTGSGSLVTRVTATPINPDGTTTPGAKSGLMWRDGTAGNAAFADLVYVVGQGLQFHYRNAAGATAVQSYNTLTTLTAPFWLKLTRGGNYCQAYYSTKTSAFSPPSGSDWTLIGNYAVPMTSGNVQAGLVVTSHTDGSLASATFDNFALAPNTAPTFGALASQTVAENSAAVLLPLTVADAESPVAGLALSVSSSNTMLLPPENLNIASIGTNRWVRFAPGANQAGTATVTVSANDGQATATTNFTITVTTTSAGGWRQQYFGNTANSGQGADGANPAGDGITNFFKRAFGLNPLVAVANQATAWPQAATDANAGTLGLNYTRTSAANAPDLAFQVVWSHDLQNWSASGVSDATTGSNTVAGTETHAATVPLSLGSPIFLKLQVTRSP